MITAKSQIIPTIADIYNEYDFIDAKDSQGDWRVGYIVEKNQATKVYKIRFDGWSLKYDEAYKFTSVKLKPFRSIVVGYTGQQQNAALREGWKFTKQTHEKRMTLISQFFKFEQLQNLTVHQINQFIRGHNYLYTDFLMTCAFPDIETMKSVFDYFKLNVLFLVKYLEFLNTDIIKVITKLEQPQAEFQAMSNYQAFVRSYYEIFDTIYIIYGLYPRFEGFFRQNADLLQQLFSESKIKETAIRNKFQFEISKIFGTKGFSLLKNILTKILESKDLYMPFQFLYSLTNLLGAFTVFLDAKGKQSLIELIKNVGLNNLKNIQDKHLKDFHKIHAINYINSYIILCERTSFQKGTQQFACSLEFFLCLKMIRCSFFEKKLKGISGLIQLCERREHILANGMLEKLMKENNLLEYLFQSNDNQQIIKKASQFAKYLFAKHCLKENDINLIWNSRVGKHQTSTKQIYSIFAEFPLYDRNIEHNVQLFDKIKKVDQREWDQEYIKMIRNYSLNSFKNIDKEKEKEKFTFGFNVLFNYAIKFQTDFAIEEVFYILKHFENTDYLIRFQNNCFQNIKKNNYPEMHLTFLVKLAENHLTNFKDSTIRMNEILIMYLILNCNNEEKLKNIEDAFDLFVEVLKNSSLSLSIKDFQNLWKHFQKSKAKEAFMKWIMVKKQNGRIFIKTFVSSQYREDLIQDLWPDNNIQNFINMDENQINFFIELFKCVNIAQGNIKRINTIPIRVETLNLQGYQKIWLIFKNVKNEKSIETITNFIAQLHTCSEQKKSEVIFQNLVKQISHELKEAEMNKNIQFLERLLNLTKKIILRDEEVYPITSTSKYTFLKQMTVTNKTRNEEKTFKFNLMGSLYELKKVIADKFNLPLHSFQMLSKGQPIGYYLYFKSVNECQMLSSLQIIELSQETSQIKLILNKKLQLFFHLLGDARIQKQVWAIVSKLPVSEDLKYSVIKSQNILIEIKDNGLYKELYMLRVILEMDCEWWVNFKKNSNILILLANYQKITLNNSIQYQYLAVLTSILVRALSEKKQLNQEFIQKTNIFISSLEILRIMFIKIKEQNLKNYQLEEKIIKNIFLIGEITKQAFNPIKSLLQVNDPEQMLLNGLIQLKNVSVRKLFLLNLKKMLCFINEQDQKMLLNILLKRIFSIAIHYEDKDDLKQYFELTSFFLQKVSKPNLVTFIQVDEKNLCLNIFNLLEKEQPERSNQLPNQCLIGYISILSFLTSFQEEGLREEILKYLLEECLFSSKNSKCKTKQSRNSAFNLIQSVFLDSNSISQVINFLSNFHHQGKWRSRKYDDWCITQGDKMKSSTGYVGLKNLGCICYMNSLFQQIFMISQFRKAVLSCQDSTYSLETQKENVLFQLQKMFLNLELSSKKFYSPKDFCHAFKDYDGNPTNVTEQMDIDEFSGILFDRLENQMKTTSYGDLIKNTFGGVFSNEIICKGCPHFSESEQSFLSISLTVKGKKNIYLSFDTMIKGDTLDGQNAYFCQRCNKKVSAVKRVSLKKLPNNLIITLKRFQFNYQTMTKLKVNDYCEFPVNLNLKEYSRQFLRKQEKAKAMDEDETCSDDYYCYVLKGIVVHLGYADSGHYYSYIQERDGSKWFEFNDTVVRNFNPDQIAEECFGGDSTGYQSKEKIKNAYMLIYERQKKHTESETIPIKTNQQIIKTPPFKETITTILNENKEEKIENILFSHEYTRFLSNMLQEVHLFAEKDSQKILKYLITAYLTITLRQKSDLMTFSLLKKVQPLILQNKNLCEWILHLFSEDSLIDQFYKNNPHRDIRKYLAYWLIQIFEICSTDIQFTFCNLLLNKIVADNQNTLEFCLILYEISKSQKVLSYLVRHNIIGRYIENIIRKQPRVFVDKLQIIERNMSGIGNQIIIEKVNDVKRIKIDNENGYVWAMINKIIKQSKKENLPIEKYITETQSSYLALNSLKVFKILEEIRNTFQLDQFIEFLCYRSIKEDQSITNELLVMVQRGLKEFQSKRYRQFFRLFESLIKIQDDYSAVRLLGFHHIIQSLKQNEQYSSDSNIIQQWILMLVNRNSNLREYLLQNVEILEYLYKLPSKKVPSDEIARKNHSYNDSMISKLHGIKFPKSKKNYVKICKEMEVFYENLIQNKYEESSVWPIESSQEKRLQIGCSIAYFDCKDELEYEEGRVQGVYLGRIEVLLVKKNKLISVWKDDEKISMNLKLTKVEDDDTSLSSKTTEMDNIDEDELFDSN